MLRFKKVSRELAFLMKKQHLGKEFGFNSGA
jgi:hypothetical protein